MTDPEPVMRVRRALANANEPLMATDLAKRCGLLHHETCASIAAWLVRQGEADLVRTAPSCWRITAVGWAVNAGLAHPERRPL